MLDTKSGFWQVEISLEDRETTASSTGQELCQFKFMLFDYTMSVPYLKDKWKLFGLSLDSH